MTDYALLKKIIQNKTLQGVSCIIIDEAHERTLYTDLVLGMLKSILNERLDLRLIVTSATMNNNLFIKYFGNKHAGIIDVPGRTYPVEIIWFDRDVEIGWNYVKECVETAIMIHQEESEGDILVFLTSPGEIDEAIMIFRDSCQESEMPQLISLHGKSDLKEQLLVFESHSNNIRKIVFATNTAETSLTIPGIKYVIDSGMTKEMTYFPHKNKSCLAVSFINKSSAEQRKGRAGRTQPGLCYRLYSKRNFEEDFPDSPTPEILKTNLQKALLKLYQFGIEPTEFDFVESPPSEAIFKSLDSLEHLGLIQEKERTKKFCLTKLGKQVCDLPLEPRLAKFVIEGVQAEIGYETIIMAALVQEAGRLFFRTETIKEEAYRRKKVFCQKAGDLCTYLEVYKRWMEEAKDDRYNWCVQNFINSKALHSASRTIEEVLKSLYQELCIRISRRYNNNTFECHYERVIFNCFSENLCVFSGHPKMGYYSLHFKESLFIHPASSLSYLKTDLPTFLVYGTLMETTRSFLMDVTPIKEETLQQAYQKGIFHLDVNMVKSLQIIPKVLGPFGQSVLVNHILGKRGSKIIDLELLVEKLVKSRNFKIDVQVDKGIILIYLEKRYHETVSRFINNMVDEAHIFMSKEEETIKIKNNSSYFCLGAGGLISDIIMPGEFKEVVIDNLSNFQSKSIKESLKSFGSLQSLHVVDKGTNFYKISVTYVKVASAQKAMLYLSQQKGLKLKAIVYVPDENEVVPLYKMEVSWCRHFAVGKGWIEFYSEADCILASGKLNLKPFYLNDNYIQFTPSYSSKILDINNLPRVIEENTIKEKLQKVLPDVKIRQIYIVRKKMPPVSEKDIEHVRKELKKLFSQSSLIDLKYPNPESIFWKALVYFKNWQDGAKAYSDLEDCAKIDSVPVQIRVIKESHLQCKKDVYDIIEEEIHFIKNKYLKNAKFSIFLSHGDTLIDIRFSCKNMPTLFDIHLELSQLLQGEIINCFEPKYHNLLTSAASCKIQKIGQRTKTAIIVDKIRKLISVFGVKKNRIKASMEVRSIVFENCRSKKRRFDVKDPNIPHGFLKNIYSKYGLKLNGLISAFCLKNAEVDSVSGKLVVEGTQSNLDKLEEHLENICNELYKKNLDMNNDEDADTCPICFDSLIYGFSFRLENCGHAFCETCLILQIESRTIPLICVKQNCDKKFFWSDIKKLLNKCTENARKDFYAVSLNYFINQRSSQVFYCPSPDCHNVFRVSSTDGEQFCFGCGNVICTKCKTLYHYGMSCEIYQNIEKDEDYSVKLWMQKDKALRKQCSYCQAVIEKVSGCNHMECYNCHKHLCWLCLKIFPLHMMFMIIYHTVLKINMHKIKLN
ncbi:ATP-dependent RNA helicase DEAH12, chloroplastic [Caerostris extrusa]|uniref:ATP-dependent RNA helicase DEAH12, chloroplastic n=1 Tax=Caerostris extrusa TaxID=172846 RepID=A0AAV4SD81_CAEEX|nr:ATP-dependent RNA helicase DEAH12, chloroplastic [Caerostris extrusa]